MINLTAASFAFLEIAIGWVIAGFILILELLILWFIWIGTTKNYWQYDRVNKRWVWNPRGIDLEFLLSDEKGYASFSRFQFLIFTFVIALSIVLITFSAKDVNCLKNNPNNQQNCPNIPAFPNIPLEIIALLGVSGGSYVIAKSIDSSQNGISVPPAEPPTPPKIIKNDTGRVADEFSKGKTNTLLFDLHLLESQVTDNLTEVANATPVDMREEFEKSIKETHRDLTFEQIFNKRNSIRTHQMLQQMLGSEILGERAFTEESNIISIPAQTSAGFGFFYKEQFRVSFTTGTLLLCEIVCPDSIGGSNVSEYLFLTATNRAAKGVEALVTYGGPNKTSFQIFDWALYSPLQPKQLPFKTVPFAIFRDYLWKKQFEGEQYQVLSLMNATTQSDTNPNYWYNEVRVFNSTIKKWARLYRQGYTATLAEQKMSPFGSWGPIIEVPNLNAFHGTNAMGFLNTQLCSCDDKKQWSQPTPLRPSDSDAVPEAYGFHPRFVKPNYNWVVTS